MKRVHIHLRTRDLEKARAYYTALFGQGPTLVREDYLKWRLDDPAVNLAITPGQGSGKHSGVAHLGLDLEQPGDLSTLRDRLEGAGHIGLEEKGAHCCYAHSDKVWSQDADGVVWEGFLTHGLAGTRDGDPTGACSPGESRGESRDEAGRDESGPAERRCCAG